MRIYIPATFTMLREFSKSQHLELIPPGYAFSAAEACKGDYSPDEIELIEHGAFVDASEASIRLLQRDMEENKEAEYPYRRVVISADIPDKQATVREDLGVSVVSLDPAKVELNDCVCVHIDIAESEAETAKAMEAIQAADLGDEDAEFIVGDALDNFMAWYDISELPAMMDIGLAG